MRLIVVLAWDGEVGRLEAQDGIDIQRVAAAVVTAGFTEVVVASEHTTRGEAAALSRAVREARLDTVVHTVDVVRPVTGAPEGLDRAVTEMLRRLVPVPGVAATFVLSNCADPASMLAVSAAVRTLGTRPELGALYEAWYLSSGDRGEVVVGGFPPSEAAQALSAPLVFRTKDGAMKEAMQKLRGAARSRAPILLLGESGVGKELLAKESHVLSGRTGPYVAINCGALPENLIESELFGHEKGAFTGADARRLGKVEHAGGGTLFLDEVADAPLSLQVKLLRFIQERTFQRVGGTQEIEADVKLVAATNVDLRRAIAERRFREDLYYRLNVITVNVPPLRERKDDIQVVLGSIVRQMADEGQPLAVMPDTLDALRSHHWPGNVRELKNSLERIFAAERAVCSYRSAKRCIDWSALPEMRSKAGIPDGVQVDVEALLKWDGRVLDRAEELVQRQLIEAVLKRSGRNLTRAAGMLRMSKQALSGRMGRLGITLKPGG